MPRSESPRAKLLLVVSMILVGSLAACERRANPPQPKTSAAAPAPAATPAAPPPASTAAAAAATSVSDADKTFVDQAVASGMTEVAITAHTMDKAASPRVKEIATLLNTDHTATNQELTRLAAKKGVAVPTTPKQDEQAEIKQIRGLTGADLDNAVVPKLAEAHRQAARRGRRGRRRPQRARAMSSSSCMRADPSPRRAAARAIVRSPS